MYLVVGGSGYLGRYCIRNILEHTGDAVAATWSHGGQPVFSHERLTWVRLDVRDAGAVRSLNERLESGTKAIYLAAFHHPDKVEEDPRLAWDINITALAGALNALTRLSCLYYASTDTVYGEGSPERRFSETDPCAPVNRYGRHKVLAEQITLEAGFNVVRFPFLFGPSLVEGRPHFFDIIRAELEKGRAVEMFSDSYRSTLSFDQGARYLVALMETWGACPERVVNIASDGPLSKYETALCLADHFQLNRALVRPLSVREGGAIFKARRAQSAVLDNTRIKALLNLEEIHLEL